MRKFKSISILFIFMITLFISFSSNVYAEDSVYTFDYTGNYQEFIVPKNGYYKVELWGAQGGNWATSPRVGGYGGYTAGEIFLEKGTKLYVYVGQENTGPNGTSWNGGTATSSGSAGGGATDIRLVANTDWKNFNSLKSRIMVAAGGGSAGGYTSDATKKAVPGAGGGLTGKNGGCTNPGTQTSGGPDQWGSGYAGGFGYSGNGEAGGGGYYGGGACNSVKGAGGGSSFISGHLGCNAISSLSSQNSIAHTGQPNHYSGYVFTNTKMIDGDGYPWTTVISSTYTGMPTHNGTVVMKGNTGNGYAKISLIIASSVKSVTVDNAEVVEIDKNNYNVFIDDEELDTNVNVEFMNKVDGVFGTGNVKLVSDTIHEVIVIEDGNISIIKLNVKQKPFDISIGFDEISFDFDKKIYNYNLSLDSKYKDLTLNIAVGNGITYQIENNTNLRMGMNEVLVKVSKGTKTITYTFNVNRYEVPVTNLNKTFNYTGNYQTYNVQQDGYYKIELWGAQGGNWVTSPRVGGYGGYTSGIIYLTKGTNLYFYVGQENQGPNKTAWNGGTASAGGTIGGGATDVRLSATTSLTAWKEFDSLKTRIMVAAGGGSGYGSSAKPGSGGGLIGKHGISVNPGTQTSGGTNVYNDGNNNVGGFGYTGNGEAGGGGYYGGGSGWSAQGSSGGSSFISGHDGCDAISGSSSSFTNIIHTGQSVHYSGYKFLNTVMIDGDGYPWTTVISNTYTGMPNVDGTGTMSGNTGNGHAKITFISANEGTDTTLSSLEINNGDFPLEFDKDTFSYDVNVDADVTSLNIKAIASDINASVVGDGIVNLVSGKNVVNITVTSPIGTSSIYTINVIREASGTATLKGLKFNGILYEDFQEDKRDYEVELPYNYNLVYVEGILTNSNATITGEGLYLFENNEVTANLLVVSEDKSNNELYTIHFTKQKSTLLESATLKEISTKLNLDKNFNHKVKAPLTVHSLDIDIVPYYTGVNIEIAGNKYLGEKYKTITITSSLEGLESSVYTIELEYDANEIKYVYDYPYTGVPQTFIAPATGYYDVELWGGQGGNGYTGKQVGGYGGYTKGTIYLEKDQTLYVYVGENRGKANYTTFNGGTSNAGGYAGAGATDVRLTNGTWNNFDSLKTRLMVAAGGGSGYGPSAKGGAAGGLSGYPGGINNPGTQTKGGAKGWTNGNTGQFGIGGNGEGGGGGYYGGGSGWSAQGSGGGSSFISGHPGCNAIAGNSTVNNIVHTGKTIHYSGMYFTNSTMIDGMGYSWVYSKQGLMLMPKPSGGYYPSGTGHVGNGYARISSADLVPNDNYLDSLVLTDNEKNNVDINFESWTLDYDVNLTSEQTKLDISAVPKDLLATVTGTGTIEIPPNDSTHEITVTAQDGSIRVYTLNINREPSNDPTPNDIKVNRMTPSLCKLDSSYCKYTFDADTYKYDIILPFTLKEVEVLPVLKSKYQTLVYKTIDSNGDEVEVQNSNGVFSITGDTTIIVEITSEDDARVSRYEYNFTKDITGDNYLQDIIITNPDIEVNFARDTYEYYLTLPKGYNSYDVEAIPEREENTKVTITGNTNLKVGMNDCIITVTAENGNRKTYLIHMYKEYEANVMLKSLTVDNGGTNLELSPVFDPKLNNYTLNVDASVKTININAVPDDSSAVISGTGSKILKSGVNTLDIIVTQGDVTNTYTIVVNKALDDNPNVKNITIDGFTLDQPFDKDITEYYIYIDKDVNKLNIDVTMESSSAKYTIRGDSNLGKTVNEIVITGIAENKTYKVYKIYAMKSISDNNYLASLTTSEGTLSPAFDKETDNYSIVVDPTIDKLEINATAEDSGAIVKGTGTYYVGVGINTVEIKVTSESGKIKTYTIEITKAQNNDVTLKEVKNNQGSEVTKIEDTSLGYDYLINVQYEVNSIEITGIPNASTSTVTGNKIYSLKTGDNDITLTVTAEDGSTKSYIVRIVRDKSNNDDLDFLYVEEGGLSPSFNETIILYDVKVPNNTNLLHIEAITEDKNATYEVIGGTKLDNGKYTYDISSFAVDVPQFIEVVVTAENGIDKKIYTLSVTKQQTTTDNLALLDLIVKQGEITQELIPIFNPDTLNYELTVENNVTEVEVSATALGDNVQVLGEGIKSLNVGKNAIAVFVIGESGVQRDYQIVVTRKKSSDATLASLVVKGSTLNPKFNSNTENYTLKTSASNLDFTTIKPTETEAIYEIIGNENFITGENVVTIRVTAPDGETTKDYTLTITKEGSKNNNLSSLEVTGYTLVPKFHKGVTFYTVEVENDVNSILIKGTSEDVNATINGLGAKTIVTGENYFDVVVTSEAGTSKTYTILVTKEASDNNYLASLTSSDGTLNPSFDKLVNDYEITVSNEIDSIEFFGSLEDANALVQGLENHQLHVGENKFEIIVTSESGKINVYNVIVTREAMVSAYLSNLEVKDYELDPEFNKEIFEYYLNVDNEITSLDLTYIPEDANATVEVTGNENFEIGMNEVHITVTSSDNSLTEDYILYVNRQMSTNNYLTSLYVNEGTLIPDFEKETLNYKVTVPSSIASIEVSATTEDETAKITSGIGTHNLNPGLNTILIKVRSSIGVTRTYKIEITREESTNKELADLVLKTLDNDTIASNPIFNSNTLDYEYTLDSTLEYVKIEAFKGDTYQSIIGDGVKELKPGVNKFEVIVTAQNGDVNTYTLTVNNPLDTNNYLSSLIPSVGTLSPEFDKDTLAYTLDLENEVNTLSFTFTTESNKATVTGCETKGVDEGTSIRNIVVTAEDGSTKTYVVTINREQASNALLESLTIDNYPFEFNSDTFTYNIAVSNSKKVLLESEITAIAKDTEATINMMGDLNLTDGIVNIYIIEVIAKDGYTTQTYTLNITRDSAEYTLRSNVYEIVRFEEEANEDYVIGIQPSTLISDFKDNFENDPLDLKVYLDTTEVQETDLTATALILKLEKNGHVYDTLRVIVRGDLTKDGKVNITDQVKMINYVGRTTTFDKYQMLAGDLTFDGKVNITDQVKIINYVGRTISDLNNKPTS